MKESKRQTLTPLHTLQHLSIYTPSPFPHSSNLNNLKKGEHMSQTAEASVYGVMESWLTPSCLFIFINLVIGTIAITSRFANTTKTQHQLVRSPSLLERFKSFNLRYYKHEPTTTFLHSQVDPAESKLDFNKVEIEQPDPVPIPIPQQLNRAPSILQRLKSSLSFDRSDALKVAEPKSEAEVTGGGELVEEREEEKGVDAKADDFINRFRQQLRMQRLDSIIRYRDMLKRN